MPTPLLCRCLLLATLCLSLPACKRTDQDIAASVSRAIEADRSGQVQSTATDTAATAPKPTTPALKEGQKLLVVSVGDGREPFMAFQSIAMKLAMRAVDGIVVETLDAKGDADLQLQQLNEVLKQKPTYLVLDALAVQDVQSLAQSFATAGTQVISVDERLTGPAFAASPHTLQKELGKTAAATVVEALRRKAKAEGATAVTGRVVHLLGDEFSFRSTARAEGFHEGLKVEPGIVVVHESPTDWDAKISQTCTEEALKLQRQFDVIVAQSDLIALGASQAISTAQLRDDVMIIGMDALGGEGGGIELVAKGTLDASVHHAKPMKHAFDLIQKAQTTGGKLSPSAGPAAPMAIEVITSGNVDEALRRVRSGEL
jgi:ABC-type sugar transport system substrate-binding protein